MAVKNNRKPQTADVKPFEAQDQGLNRFRSLASIIYTKKGIHDVNEVFSISSLKGEYPIVDFDLAKMMSIMESLIEEMNATY